MKYLLIVTFDAQKIKIKSSNYYYIILYKCNITERW